MGVSGKIWLLLICFLGYQVLHARAQQYHSTTDPEKCCPRKPNTTISDSTCRPTRLTASQFQQSITTPHYPKAFDADTFCSWEIVAIPGRRILLDFRNLHLTPKDAYECVSQRLIIRSPLTGLSMGPFCGHDGLPNVVTAGNFIIVELQSPNPTNGRSYKGFELVYAETVQATSIALRPPDWSDGMYLEYRRPGRPTRPSRFKPTRTTKPTTTHVTGTEPTQKVQKKRPPKQTDRVMANPSSIRTLAPYPYVPPPRTPTRIHETPNDDGELGTEVIVGIVVGGIIMVAIVSVVVAKLGFYRAEKRRKRENESDEELKEIQQYPSPVQKTSQLPAVWRPNTEKKVVRSPKTTYKTAVSRTNELHKPSNSHKSPRHRSNSHGKPASSKNHIHVRPPRDRNDRSTEKRKPKDTNDRPHGRDRRSAKKSDGSTEKVDRNSNRPKHRKSSGHTEKKPKRRTDRHAR